MARSYEVREGGSWVEELSGGDLRDFLDAGPVARCSACQRKTWEPGMVGRTCHMMQPDGSSCPGVFRAA